MNENFLKFLDEGGRFVIKKQNDKTMVALEVEVDRKTRHAGFNPREDDVITMTSLEDSATTAIRSTKRIRANLGKE